MESVKLSPPQPPSLRGDLLALLPVALAVVAFYAWTVGSNAPEPLVAPHQGDYYNLLAEGMAEGHLYMKAEVGPILLLPPEKRPASYEFLLDASLYRGHYYLYFGVAPELTIFLPFRLLTGLELNQLVVVGTQGAAAFLVGLGLLLILRRHFAPGAGRLALAASALAWGFGSALPVTLRKPHMYEVAITAGLVWSTAFLLFAALAVLRPGRAVRWLALASLCAGLAAGSRPDLLLGATALGGVLAWLHWNERRAGTLSAARFLRRLAAAVAPAALCGAGLLLYNARRFGDPLEFGHRYQMGSSAVNFFSARYFWHNLQMYYLTPPAAGWLFPFFAEGIEQSRPVGYIGIEPLHGQFYFLVWFGFLALVVTAWRWRAGAGDPRRRMVAALFLWWFGANFLLVACSGARANRYLLDFHPALVLAGCGLFLEASALPPRILRRFALALGAVGVAAIAAFNAGISIETMAFMLRVNPVGYARLERACNRLAWPFFRLTNPRFGPRVFQVSFPVAPPGSFEPLISAGPPLDGISLMVHYLEPGRAQLLLTSNQISDDQTGGPRGLPFAVHAGETRQLSIALGSFYPPIGHPWFGAATGPEMQLLATTARVVLDGQDILRLSMLPRAVSPGQVEIGRRRPWAVAGVERFSGRLRELREGASAPAEPAPSPGAGWGYRIVLQLPADRFGTAEPLLTTGAWPIGDAILLEYRDRSSVTLLHDQIGGGLIGSTTIPVDYEKPQAFDVWFDPAPPGEGPQRYRLSIFLEGRPVLLEQTLLQPFAYGQEAVASSVIHSSMARDSFGGAVLAVERTDSANVARRVMPEHGEAAAAVRFRLPPPPEMLAQPLLVFSRADGGQGLLALRRSGANVQIGWRDAAGWWWSRALPALAAGSHTVGAQWSLAAGGASGAEPARAREAMILVDGLICQLPRPEFFSAAIEQVSAWHNPWPADPGVAGHFTGVIEPPPPIRTLLSSGPSTLTARRFRLAVRFPANRPGRNEPLVTAGRPGAADSLYVHYEREGWVRLGFDHWGIGGPLSAPVPVTYDVFQIIDAELGAGSWEAAGPGEIKVGLNGQPVLRASATLYSSLPNEVTVGRNAVGLSTSDPAFSGEIFRVEELDPAP